MARYRRRRYYRKKGRWSANIQEIVNNNINATPEQFFATQTLVVNPAQNSMTTSQLYTVKNIECSFEISNNESASPLIESLAYYIMFVPQGMTVPIDYNLLHPEYVMAYRFYGSPENETTNTSGTRIPVKIRTRLARKLNTGDSIVLLIKGLNELNQTFTVTVNGLVRWWSKAN